MLLWGRAAGRCEFSSCNRPLWKSPVTQEPVNIAQKAHIYAFSSGGPRGNRGLPKRLLNSAQNLMLVCCDCHKIMDKDQGGTKYSADLLQKWKEEHERRIETVTGVNPEKKSHVLLYGAKIGKVDSPLSFNEAALAMFPAWYPAEDRPLELGVVNDSFENRDKEFYEKEEFSLARKYRRMVGERLAERSIRHISLFALAPQPLLVRLGSLLTDVNGVLVYVRSREPQSWQWRSHPPGFKYKVIRPQRRVGPPVLVLSLSDHIPEKDVRAAVGRRATFWTVTVRKPNNDFLRSRRQLSEFRECARHLMVDIEKMHGKSGLLHIFMAAPAAIAVELGRIRMPQANLKWRLYDRVRARGGFIRVLDID